MLHALNSHAFTDCVLNPKTNLRLFIQIRLFQLYAPSFEEKFLSWGQFAMQMNWAGLAQNGVEMLVSLTF